MIFNKIPMDLQMFADEGAGDAGDNPEVDGVESESDKANNPEEKTTQEIIDDAVEERLARADKKHEAELAKVKEKAKADAERYADMTEKEKESAEMTDRIAELEAREKELNNRELLNNIQADLTERKLPTAFADALLVIQDNEKIKESIEEIKEIWDAEITEAKKESVRQPTPNDSSRSYAGEDKAGSKSEFFDSGRKI